MNTGLRLVHRQAQPHLQPDGSGGARGKAEVSLISHFFQSRVVYN
jgi:hypothetical protein